MSAGVQFLYSSDFLQVYVVYPVKMFYSQNHRHPILYGCDRLMVNDGG